jgi:chorismate synthase
MPETTTDVRADIDQTRARMSGAIAELERKVDVAQRVKDHPWMYVAVAFGAGVALSSSRADVKAAQVTARATKETGSKLGGALDGVVAALVAGVTEAFHSRIDAAVSDVVMSIRGDSSRKSIDGDQRGAEPPIRAD